MNEDACRSWRIARQSEVVLCIVYERREIKGYLFFNAKLFIVIDNMMQKLINHFLSPYYQQVSTNTTSFYKHGLPQQFFFMDVGLLQPLFFIHILCKHCHFLLRNLPVHCSSRISPHCQTSLRVTRCP
jgi:hypothetical protein